MGPYRPPEEDIKREFAQCHHDDRTRAIGGDPRRPAGRRTEETGRPLGDPEAPVTRKGTTHNLRWAILAVIGETSRHAGHADIIREQLDGTTGR
ncbi:DUF664 domain-containing protein [Kribbella sindirgiensis]|uniref:DUF664 domain-containing protein n=1 Tax=Kribbella sindirgiensis TaxID=1124744 RepID=A0A4R0I5F4_9ACTN|nr:DUF664 domain-containing protein [Kribbella sindirgiensis]